MGKVVVSFQEDENIIRKVDELAPQRGSDRSAIITEAVRK